MATLGFFTLFFSVINPKPTTNRLRSRSIFLYGFATSLLVVALTVYRTSWSNLWLVAQLLPIMPTLVRYGWFEKLGYTRWRNLDGGGVAVAFVLYLVGNLAPPEGLTGWLAMLPFVAFGVMGLEAVFFRIRKMIRAGKQLIAVGQEAPGFTLESHRGESVSLSDFRGKRPVLLFFVRGDWCPGCHIMLRAYQRNRARFIEKNVAVLAIGPDPVGVNREMVETLRLEYGLLSDEDASVAKKYRALVEGKQPMLPYESGMTLPASLLIDKDGIVRFSSGSEAGKILEPEAVFAVLEDLPA